MGPEGLAQIATVAEVAVNGVVGFAGLTVTMAALEAGRRLALANKESIIAGAPVVQRARRTPGAEIIPVDSEHCAVHQCLRAGHRDDVERLLLTASGGPFRGRTGEELAAVDVAAALAHPTWSMGPKITVDSSTLMNKGLEVIEAHELFGIPYDAIDVVVHPQSVVHSMVEFTDGAVVAQLSMPDMRLPIGYALAYPDRLAGAFGAIDWATLSVLEFEPPDRTLFRCLDLAYRAGRVGGLAPAWLSAANEVAVAGFLDGRISGTTSPTWWSPPSTATTSRRPPSGRSSASRSTMCWTPTPGPEGWPRRPCGAGRLPHERVDTRMPEGIPLDRPRPGPSPTRSSRPGGWRPSCWWPSPSSWPWPWPPVTPTSSSSWSRIIVMVMIHELGHFLAAKRGGMKVTEYFLGFGPRLWSFRRGETEYGIKALPLGGLREDPRDDQPRGGRPGRRGPHLP